MLLSDVIQTAFFGVLSLTPAESRSESKLCLLVSQINSRPVVGNGGFPFSSPPNGNTYYSENK